MEYVYLILFSIVSLVLGSFSNVVIYRLPRKILLKNHFFYDIDSNRSMCPKCGNKISWYDNVPLLSYLLLHGKCRHCDEKISLSYFIVELSFFIIAFPIYWLSTSWIDSFVLLGLYFILFNLFIIDFKSMLLPNLLTYPIFILAFIYVQQNPTLTVESSIMGGFAAFIISYVSNFIVRLFKRIDVMGAGDIKLYTALGTLIGVEFVPYLFLLSSIIAFIHWFFARVSCRYCLYIPLGPSIIISFVIVFFSIRLL
ncbi:leader peptidase TcpJ [Vibrio cholerae]|uniref:toxin-coregulated pilus pre-pilin peptidase TcpJ n=1 Tax=Vibrio cholerae TaxID=666 RepID=UPI0000F1B753|nr:toxin-coregulated pilus pre-pilin peptidase TcpJ [Vibrio cholerae]EGR0074609.1 toxin-coregulated pilus pre-pilin peptidase TcpJ [Vibrio cholerae]EJL6961005.1 toxin-coregulated pilus pre-pilin peptidase TcpJ [Vibrio cholerae]EMC8696846.1 toxin-coregulated pilus pre-pilin peptidase TcpJ [Vibrio cholerae]KFD95996.1 type IV leader peptidase family protein [Vibrio cholerae]OFJ32131.1 methyltransferase [Vibrio cholerae]